MVISYMVNIKIFGTKQVRDRETERQRERGFGGFSEVNGKVKKSSPWRSKQSDSVRSKKPTV